MATNMLLPIVSETERAGNFQNCHGQVGNWKDVLERLKGFFKDQLAWFKNQGHYDSHYEDDRLLLVFLVIEKELNIFRRTIWNNHRIRHQKIPDYQMYSLSGKVIRVGKPIEIMISGSRKNCQHVALTN
ncbi:hypothetical protein LOTGIDRAFT_174984 [Lottia gigantea]|uniref:Uncharacterized protein n=1 Tax=Lottia gigantea TaxID=225164 RepID=V4AGJ2_LOTGI|nr:hypothetical protein LOTGIDRAFT_174984 [Lottia gigantea]ESO96002.1 hypothetical protein LOTGIDRAFT_174984 [Lottia gigantea]